MPERESYAAGTPSWVDLGSPDMDESIAFYSGLFGWDVSNGGGHTTFLFKGRRVAGLAAQLVPAQRPAWLTFIPTDDVHDAAAKVADGGGVVIADPNDMLVAVCADPEGARFAVCQPRAHRGAGLVDEPGSLCWNELTCRDTKTELEFYGAIFGWTAKSYEGPAAYTELQLDGRTIAGLMPMDDNWPADLPAQWMTYFAVEDPDVAATRCEELGGVVSVPPTDAPPGRFAVLNGPTGEVFSVIKMTPQN